MLRDVFYYGDKPNAHPREQFAENLIDARQKCTTEHFWVINEFCDYRNFDWDFDFEFLPDEDVWAEDHNNVWPSQHQKDSGTWLCAKLYSDTIIYRNDVDIVLRKNEKQSQNWVELDLIDHAKFDFSWHPDPTDPPYIYKWGCKFFPAVLKHVLEYHVPGATQEKYMKTIVELVPEYERWVEHQEVDKSRFDMSWRPNPLDPPFIYIWGNKYVDGKSSPTLEYRVPGATDKKYVSEFVPIAPDKELFEHLENSYGIDYSWRPNPTSPPYIYAWGNQWNSPEDKISIQLVVPGATEYKYMPDRAIRKPCLSNWVIPDNIDVTGFDFSWEPNPAAPPYIYEFATQWQKTGGPQYVVPGATEKQYIDFQKVKKLSSTENWKVPDNIDITGFDFSWHPDDTSPPYNYVFATQWAFSGGPVYMVDGATETKYVDEQVATATSDMTNWVYDSTEIDIESFDFSWHPYVEDQPYIYEFGTQWQKTSGPKYITPGADSSSPKKYIDTRILKAKRLPISDKHWICNYKIKDFDYSWHPDETEEPYIYVFGNNLHPAEEMPTIEYHVKGATKTKFVNDIVATLDTDKTNWVITQPIDEEAFDFSWKPNPNDPPYIYRWGNKYISNKYKSTIDYVVPCATDIKYMDDNVKVLPEWDRWEIPTDIDTTDFDFTWRPDPLEPELIWEFGTQWQKTGGPRYTMPDATEVKYLDTQKVNKLPSTENWKTPSNVDVAGFDFSWHPDNTEPGYIYQFGTQWALSGGPVYSVPDATEIKYMDVQTAIALPNKDNWVYDSDLIDVASFDFSWHPYVEDQPYIYEFGTQWQKTGGPKYITPGADSASPVKYIDTRILKSIRLPNNNDKCWVANYAIKDFDYSWHPDNTEEPYIYVFGNNLYPAEDCDTIEYKMPGATKVKYVSDIVATLDIEKTNWVITQPIDEEAFDFSWIPNPKDPPYIYRWGNKYISNKYKATVEYVVPGATDIKYMTDDVEVLPEWDRWEIPTGVNTEGFDFTWRPDPLEPNLIWEFGTQWQKTGGPRYVADGAAEVKYMDHQRVTKLPDNTDWFIPKHIDVSEFDFSWHPDATDPSYIYQFGTQWALSGGPRYIVSGATEIKYMDNLIATALPDKTNWVYDDKLIDANSFDFSWHPYAEDQPYVYEFGTQWQKTGGPKYIAPGADSSSPVKYIDTRIIKATRLPNETDILWVVSYAIKEFDYSWHPDETEEPYIYVFGNTLYPAEECATIEYRVPGATQVKYVHGVLAKLSANMDNWEVPKEIDTTGFDFGWIPNPNDPPYIYEFGTQHQKTGGPRYIMPGATETKYLDFQHAIILPNKTNWTIPDNIDVTAFDFSWHPDTTEPAYIYRFGTQWALSGGPIYTVPGATEVKYMDSPSAVALPNMNNWKVDSSLIDVDSFDFSWHPYAEDQPYIYEFGTQHQKTGGPKYITLGSKPSSPIKYVDVRILKSHRLPNDTDKNWKCHYPIEDFDYSWHPDETEEPYIYVFGNTQYPAEEMATVEYRMSGAVEKKYIPNIVARLAPNKTNWKIDIPIDESKWDFSWIPNPNDPPYVYVWGNQWNPAEIESTIQYVVPGATEIKYMDNTVAYASPDSSRFNILHPVVESSFDFSWRPNPKDPAYTYVFGNSQYPAEIMPTLEYNVPGATQVKYVQDFVALLAPNKTRWSIPDNIDSSSFDFSWVPDPLAPPYIYQFGTILDKNDGPRFITPNNIGEVVYLERVEIEESAKVIVHRYYIETTLEDLINEHPNEIFWAMRKNINYDNFDFDWRPGLVEVAWELNYVHVFGSPDSDLTQTYFVSAKHFLNGNSDLKFVEELTLTDENLAGLFVKPDMFFVDKGNSESAARFEALKAKFGTKIQKTRYLNSWVDTINRCINRATTELVWVLNSELDYYTFNFDYYPNPWQMKMVHVFGTQWSHWGTTFMVNRESFPEDTKYIKIIEHLSMLNFVKEHRAIATDCVYDVVVIDHGNYETTKVVDLLKQKASAKNVTVLAYDHSYLKTIQNLVSRLPEKKEHYLWICSSVCDYADFDFSYICDPFAKDQLHVFPSGIQKFGDTFFVDVNKARELISEMEKLEDFHKVNFNNTVKAKRLPEPVIVTTQDTHSSSIKNITGFPYATLITDDNLEIDDTLVEPMNLWAPDTKNILITSTGATRIVVPAEAKDYASSELYEYPYIKRMPKLAKSKALDIVFVSNGELVAEQNFEHLFEFTSGLPNKIHRVDGINGRTEALHAAAERSETPWFFCVPAKLLVNKKFDWNYQADRLQLPKHYIFNAHNPVNDLFYGHQSMVLYNKNLVLGNKGVGLDFTLDSPHMTVELNSGIVVGDTDAHSTWRTAFREVVKLKRYSDNGDEIAKQRLDVWINVGKGDYGQWSIMGAIDGLEFYDEVDGDLEQLRQSYYWDWLKDRFDNRY
jgi:hypothetical protein